MLTRVILTIAAMTAMVCSTEAEEMATPGIPSTMTYQGFLTDPQGNPVADGGYNLTVRIYDAFLGGAVQWQELVSVNVSEGVFSALLGQTNPLDILDYDQHYWLTTQVNSDPEVSPRVPMSSTPYAFIAGSVAGGVAVTSLNGVQNGVSLVAGPGMTVTPSGQDIILSSSGGSGGVDTDWGIDGNDMFAIPTGNVGVGTTVPQHDFHVVGNGGSGVQFKLEDVTDPGQQAYQLSTLWIETALGKGQIAMTTTASQKTMQVYAQTPGTKLLLRAEDEIRLDYFNRMRIWRDGGSVAEFSDQDELRIFAEPSGEDIGVIIRGQDPNGFNDGGEIILYDAGNNMRVRMDGYANSNVSSIVELYGENNNPGVQLWGQSSASDNGGTIRLNDENGNLALNMVARNTAGAGNGGSRINLYHESGGLAVELSAQEDGLATQGGVLKLYNDLGQLAVELDGDYGSTNEGRVITGVLEITGGSDLSEQFDVSGLEAVIAPGSVVCIDPERPGELKMSDRAYDTCVAGVISGAGGVRPGMVMGQRGSEADGEYPVALTGRVYVHVDASNGPVKPGDLLTTAEIPGHAMKVADSGKAQGAVLGKAMTSLESGQGLVLVLVSLQ